MNHQLLEGHEWVETGSVNRSGDEVPSTAVIPENPIAEFFERAAFVAAGGPASWNESTSSLVKQADRVAANRLGLREPYGSAASLNKTARVEERTAGGDRWLYRYNADNEIISASVIDQDGGELEKRAEQELDFSDIEADSQIGKAKRLHDEWAEAEALLET